ncbi:MAG TPA: glycoside hydrolase family 57 protein [Rhodanobacteraceae bacterium]
MARELCFYFQVHQPWRLRRYTYAEVGRDHDYFDATANAAITRRVADKCYLPMNALLRELIARHQPHFRVSFSITATALEQMAAYAPDALLSFRQLIATGHVELLSETSHHTLAALYSPREFADEVEHHRAVCTRLLGPPGRVFRNTELIVDNHVARQVASLGYTALCMEGADRLMDERAATHPQRFTAAPGLIALPRHYRLSDDIAFRFSNRQWAAWPLTAERFADWVDGIDADGFLGLFMDYETFGEHQWADTGIFDFMRALPAELLRRGRSHFITAAQAAHAPADAPQLDIPDPVSWADLERDTSAWDGNRIQRAALDAAFALEKPVRAHGQTHPGKDGQKLLEDWRRLLTSDHTYYMSTKHWSDGDVHQYFSPFESPYDAYINYMNVIEDMRARLGR